MEHRFWMRILPVWGFDASNRPHNASIAAIKVMYCRPHIPRLSTLFRIYKMYYVLQYQEEWFIDDWLKSACSSHSNLYTKSLTKKFVMVYSLCWTVEWHRVMCSSKSYFCFTNDKRHRRVRKTRSIGPTLLRLYFSSTWKHGLSRHRHRNLSLFRSTVHKYQNTKRHGGSSQSVALSYFRWLKVLLFH